MINSNMNPHPAPGAQFSFRHPHDATPPSSPLQSSAQRHSGVGVGGSPSGGATPPEVSVRAHARAVREAYEIPRADGRLPQLLTFGTGACVDYRTLPHDETLADFTRTVQAASHPDYVELVADDARLTYAIDRLIKVLSASGATPRAEFVVERASQSLTRSASNWFVTKKDRQAAAQVLEQLRPAEFVWAYDALLSRGHVREFSGRWRGPLAMVAAKKLKELEEHLGLSEQLGRRVANHIQLNLPVGYGSA